MKVEALEKEILEVRNKLNAYLREIDISNNLAIEYKNRLTLQATISEKILKIKLNNLKIKYEFQKIISWNDMFFIVDFYLPEYHLIIEVDGYYHDDSKQKYKDLSRTKRLGELGFNKILRIDNIQAKNIMEKDLLKKIKAIIGQKKQTQIEKKIIKYKQRIHQLETLLQKHKYE